jgi:hypothetical protein
MTNALLVTWQFLLVTTGTVLEKVKTTIDECELSNDAREFTSLQLVYGNGIARVVE